MQKSSENLTRSSRSDFYTDWKRGLNHRQLLIRGLIDKSRALRGITTPLSDPELHLLVSTWEENFEGIPDDALIPTARKAAHDLKPGQFLDAVVIRAVYLAQQSETTATTQYLDVEDFLKERPNCVTDKL